MTCDIFGTGQTNILALCYLFGKTWPVHSSATQATESNALDQITGNVIGVSRTHIPLKALMIDSLETCEIEKCSVSEPVFKHNHCARAFTTKNVVLGRSLISSHVKKTCQ